VLEALGVAATDVAAGGRLTVFVDEAIVSQTQRAGRHTPLSLHWSSALQASVPRVHASTSPTVGTHTASAKLVLPGGMEQRRSFTFPSQRSIRRSSGVAFAVR
jgi:hypothetical protein